MFASNQPGPSSSLSRVAGPLAGLTGADALFEGLVEGIIAQVRPTLPGLSAKQLRARLQAFRPHFEGVYQRILQEHVGGDMTRLGQDLSDPRVRAYFDARRDMAAELGQMLQQLSFEMGKTAI
jgi:hypothetical protein